MRCLLGKNALQHAITGLHYDRLRPPTPLEEDAAVIALPTFGSDPQGRILGLHTSITCDGPMPHGYLDRFPQLRRRLRAVAAQLPAPFHRVALPLNSIKTGTDDYLIVIE
jgi:hypothetical protein